MAKRYVVQKDDPVLRQKCEEVKAFNAELHNLLTDMKETVRAESGAGLAAPQIGLALRVVVIDVDEGYFEMINPVIVSQKGEQVGPEGCLSVKGVQGTVRRPLKVKAEYRDRNGKKHKITAEGFFARAVCHELDHLDGVLYIDKADELYDLPAED
ncbi:MAG: peptide deformylase [Clostridia bacterium]|jgi:peptide deformylase|nr:peptide deformylase [Clostridia bacterium]